LDKGVNEQEKNSVEQVQEGIQMASKLVKAREVYESSKNRWEDECVTVAKVVNDESLIGEKRVPRSVDSQVPNSEIKPGPGIKCAPIRMIISQGRATLVQAEIGLENTGDSSDSSENEDSSENPEGEDHRNMAGEDHETIAGVVSPVVDGALRDMSERPEELECRESVGESEVQNESEIRKVDPERKNRGWTVTQGYCPMTSPISEVEPGD
jgi:hypothetical protein